MESLQAITLKSQKWTVFSKDVKALEPDEERVVIIDGRAVKIQLAEEADLDRIHRGTICID